VVGVVKNHEDNMLKDSGTVEVSVIVGENAEKDSIYAKVKL